MSTRKVFKEIFSWPDKEGTLSRPPTKRNYILVMYEGMKKASNFQKVLPSFKKTKEQQATPVQTCFLRFFIF